MGQYVLILLNLWRSTVDRLRSTDLSGVTWFHPFSGAAEAAGLGGDLGCFGEGFCKAFAGSGEVAEGAVEDVSGAHRVDRGDGWNRHLA